MTNDTDIHLYAQSLWHDDAHIVGTAAGLRALRDALNTILENQGHSGYAETMVKTFTNDGESYSLAIHCVVPEVMACMAAPYTDRVAGVSHGLRLSPYDLKGGPRFCRANARVIRVPPALWTPEQNQEANSEKRPRVLVWAMEADLFCVNDGSDAQPMMLYWSTTATAGVTPEQRALARDHALYKEGDLRLVCVQA
ncbi:MAG: hypothetical protein ACYDDA_11985 [Acidiferrobacteraceae bacterium]